MNKKLTFTSLAAMALAIGAGSYVLMSHDSATASTSSTSNVNMPKEASEHILPGGASSLNETFQDWRLICRQMTGGSKCAVIQQEFDNKTHQRILSVELSPSSNQMKGVMVLPFGVALNKGASLVADGKTVGTNQPFSTCIPAGCLVPLTLDQKQVGDLQSAQKVEVKFTSIAGQDISLPLSNKGLDKATRRLNLLSK